MSQTMGLFHWMETNKPKKNPKANGSTIDGKKAEDS